MEVDFHLPRQGLLARGVADLRVVRHQKYEMSGSDLEAKDP